MCDNIQTRSDFLRSFDHFLFCLLKILKEIYICIKVVVVFFFYLFGNSRSNRSWIHSSRTTGMISESRYLNVAEQMINFLCTFLFYINRVSSIIHRIAWTYFVFHTRLTNRVSIAWKIIICHISRLGTCNTVRGVVYVDFRGRVLIIIFCFVL